MWALLCIEIWQVYEFQSTFGYTAPVSASSYVQRLYEHVKAWSTPGRKNNHISIGWSCFEDPLNRYNNGTTMTSKSLKVFGDWFFVSIGLSKKDGLGKKAKNTGAPKRVERILLECPSVCVDRLTSKVTFSHMHELAYIIWQLNRRYYILSCAYWSIQSPDIDTWTWYDFPRCVFPYPNKNHDIFKSHQNFIHFIRFSSSPPAAHWGVASQLVDALWTALAEVRVPGPLHTPTVQSEMVTLVNRGKNVVKTCKNHLTQPTTVIKSFIMKWIWWIDYMHVYVYVYVYVCFLYISYIYIYNHSWPYIHILFTYIKIQVSCSLKHDKADHGSNHSRLFNRWWTIS